MRQTPTLLAVALVPLLLAGNVAGSTAPLVQVEAVPLLNEAAGPGILTTFYDHYDCVGPGLPGTMAPHAPNPHTATVSGLAAALTTFTVQSVSLFTTGICPTVLGSPNVAKHDFTGRYTLTAVCGAGTQNPGALWLSVQYNMIAGFPFSISSAPSTPCIVFVGGTFSVTVTITIGSTTFLFLTLPPLGGIQLTVTQ